MVMQEESANVIDGEGEGCERSRSMAEGWAQRLGREGCAR
jgi:hypothetical protein